MSKELLVTSAHFLKICDVARYMEQETGEFWTEWLHRMAVSHQAGQKLLRIKDNLEFTATVIWMFEELSNPYFKANLRGNGGDDYSFIKPDPTAWASCPGDTITEPIAYKVSVVETLEKVVVYRDDFTQWCVVSGYQQPNFWKCRGDVQPAIQSPEQKLSTIVYQCFWKYDPPEGHNRPTKVQIVDWLLGGYGKEVPEFSRKAAERIYMNSKPSNIPKRGNLPAKNKPYPAPIHPDLSK